MALNTSHLQMTRDSNNSSAIDMKPSVHLNTIKQQENNVLLTEMLNRMAEEDEALVKKEQIALQKNLEKVVQEKKDLLDEVEEEAEGLGMVNATGNLNGDNVDDTSEYEDCIGCQEPLRKKKKKRIK